MKLAYLAAYSGVPSTLASSVHIMKMCDAYAKLGIEVTLFTSGDQTVSEEKIFKHYQLSNSFHLHRRTFPTSKIGNFLNLAFVLPFRAKKINTDLVHTRNLASAWGAARLFGIDTIFELHDLPHENKNMEKMFNSLLSSKRLLFIICITHALREKVFKLVGDKIKVYTLADGVSENNLSVLGSKLSLRNELGIKDKFTCVYTGSFYKGKGIEEIIRISKNLLNIEFLVVGGSVSAIDKMASEFVIGKNLKFVGFQPQNIVLKYQQAADVLLLPNQNSVFSAGAKAKDISAYTSPLKMFEYMATGNPILASSLPVLQEVLFHNKNAIILEPYDIDSWVEAIIYLKANPEIGKRIGTQARKDVQEFTWEKRAERIVNLYLDAKE